MKHQSPVTKKALLLHGIWHSFLFSFPFSPIVYFILYLSSSRFKHWAVSFKILACVGSILLPTILFMIIPILGIQKIKKQEKLTGADFDWDMQDIRLNGLVLKPYHHFRNHLWVCFLSGPTISVINRSCFQDFFVYQSASYYGQRAGIEITGRMRDGKTINFAVSKNNMDFNNVHSFLYPKP